MSSPLPTYRYRWSRSERQRQVARERRVGFDELLEKLAVERERLHPPILPIGHVDDAVAGDAQRVHDAEVLRPGIVDRLRRHHVAVVVVHGAFAECAPHPFERAGGGVEDDHPMVAVAVGHEHFVGRQVDERVGRAVHVRRIRVALALIALADLQHQLAVRRELQQLIVGHRFQAGNAVGGTVVAANPDEAAPVDVDAVLALGPLEAWRRATPAHDVVAGRVEHHHRRRRLGRGLAGERARTVQQPDAVLRVDGEARRIAQPPLARDLRPRRIDDEGRQAGAGLRLRGAFGQARCDADHEVAQNGHQQDPGGDTSHGGPPLRYRCRVRSNHSRAPRCGQPPPDLAEGGC